MMILPRRPTRQGKTILEILVVIAIILILATLISVAIVKIRKVVLSLDVGQDRPAPPPPVAPQ